MTSTSYTLVSRRDLQELQPGLYVVGEERDGALRPIETAGEFYDAEGDGVFHGTLRLMGRVREPGKPSPIGADSFEVRRDGREVVTQWVPASTSRYAGESVES